MARQQSDVNLSYRLARLVFRGVVQVLGVTALILVVLALTPLPGMAFVWLAHADPRWEGTPEVLVMMGGGGIPSETGLTRCYEVGVQAHRYPKARVVVAMPFEPDETNGPSRVVAELMVRGVERDRITQAGEGRHSREQALEIWKLLDGARRQPSVTIVSSPDHIRRSVLAFRKAGFKKVGGAPAFGQALRANLELPREGQVPDPARTVLFRYRFWASLIIEVRVLREGAALAYYRVRGWI